MCFTPCPKNVHFCFCQVRAGLQHAFDQLSTFFVENLVANLLHQSRHVEIDATGSLVRAR